RRRRVHRNGGARRDPGVVPAFAVAIADRGHVVGEDAAETRISQGGGASVRRCRCGMRFGHKGERQRRGHGDLVGGCRYGADGRPSLKRGQSPPGTWGQTSYAPWELLLGG